MNRRDFLKGAAAVAAGVAVGAPRALQCDPIVCDEWPNMPADEPYPVVIGRPPGTLYMRSRVVAGSDTWTLETRYEYPRPLENV